MFEMQYFFILNNNFILNFTYTKTLLYIRKYRKFIMCIIVYYLFNIILYILYYLYIYNAGTCMDMYLYIPEINYKCIRIIYQNIM
jgi:hypothetical protein